MHKKFSKVGGGDMLGEFSAVATVGVKDLAAAKKFYGETLGLTPKQELPSEMGAVLYKTGDSAIFVYESQFAGTNKATAVSWDVDDVGPIVTELKGKGVTFEHYPDLGELQGDVHVYGPMKSVWFKDPDGNILNVTSKG
jgi:catechol 2,3-dioxygenase-like lactoylglutathione lyase family enzyme